MGMQFSVKFNNGMFSCAELLHADARTDGKCPDYPSKAPHVVSITTEGGRCRFNPNIYSNGKVCL